MCRTDDVDVPFGLVGRTLGHSLSPQIHALLGSSPYGLFELEPDQLGDFVRGGGWRGLNVTIPYKQDVMPLADELTPIARRLGAANTLVRREDGSILADNTDYAGFSWMLERFCRAALGAGSAREDLAGRKVLVLGSGGASKAVVAVLADACAEVSVISRTGTDRYEGLAARHADASLLVNATPVGMYPNCPATPIPPSTLHALTGLSGVIDIVYNPSCTGLCLEARREGLPWQSGLGMLVAQARRSSEVFRSTTLDDALVEGIESTLARARQTIYLIGMPGCGKSSAGRHLAHELGRPFVDLDEDIVLHEGADIPTIFELEGERAFRDHETAALARHASDTGLVIACGGGIVERDENLDLMRQNGTLIMLDRPLDQLSQRGRPVTAAKGVRRIAQERMGRYHAWSDHVIGCTGSAQGDARAIREVLGL
jgi:shikimate dehydrogenase